VFKKSPLEGSGAQRQGVLSALEGGEAFVVVVILFLLDPKPQNLYPYLDILPP
jgi:hypothetical protein